jgi:hypothetical protein|tara:strand:- start:2292 stop:2510 length:219 start_codon:yes stop_codon:yes gene_type:complete
MINNNNFYRDLDLIFNKLNINDLNIYQEFIDLYTKYAFNYVQNLNLNNDLLTYNFNIQNDGILKYNGILKDT